MFFDKHPEAVAENDKRKTALEVVSNNIKWLEDHESVITYKQLVDTFHLILKIHRVENINFLINIVEVFNITMLIVLLFVNSMY